MSLSSVFFMSYGLERNIAAIRIIRAPFLTIASRPRFQNHHSSLYLRPYTSSAKMADPSNAPDTDYRSWSNVDLIARITTLEAQLRTQTAAYRTLQSQPTSTSSSPNPPKIPCRRSLSPSRRASPFDPSKYSTRHIALDRKS